MSRKRLNTGRRGEKEVKAFMSQDKASHSLVGLSKLVSAKGYQRARWQRA
jgi:hypothetical protein